MVSLDEKKLEQRKTTRVAFKEAIGYEVRGLDLSGGTLACDLSETGLRMILDRFIPLNTEIKFKLRFGSNSRMIEVLGKVVWVQRVPFSERYQVGIKFVGTNSYPQVKSRIHQYIQTYRF